MRLYLNMLRLQALDWLQQSGDHYLATHTSPGATMAETQELLNQYREFCVSAKVRKHFQGLFFSCILVHLNTAKCYSRCCEHFVLLILPKQV